MTTKRNNATIYLKPGDTIEFAGGICTIGGGICTIGGGEIICTKCRRIFTEERNYEWHLHDCKQGRCYGCASGDKQDNRIYTDSELVTHMKSCDSVGELIVKIESYNQPDES